VRAYRHGLVRQEDQSVSVRDLICSAGGLCRRFACSGESRQSSATKHRRQDRRRYQLASQTLPSVNPAAPAILSRARVRDLICSAGGLCRRFACSEESRRSSTTKHRRQDRWRYRLAGQKLPSVNPAAPAIPSRARVRNLICSAGGLCRRFACSGESRRSSATKHRRQDRRRYQLAGQKLPSVNPVRARAGTALFGKRIKA
jgi:hypothetical protein